MNYDQEYVNHFNDIKDLQQRLPPSLHDPGLILRFLKRHKFDVNSTFEHLVETDKWKKENKVLGERIEEWEEGSTNPYLHDGFIFFEGRDYFQRPIIVIKMSKYIKREDKQILTDCFSFILEVGQLLHRHPFMQSVLIFDLSDASLSHVDFDLISVFSALQKYYPDAISVAYVYALPWILQATWNLVISILPQKTLSRIKLVPSGELTNFISADQLNVHLGGSLPLLESDAHINSMWINIRNRKVETFSLTPKKYDFYSPVSLSPIKVSSLTNTDDDDIFYDVSDMLTPETSKFSWKLVAKKVFIQFFTSKKFWTSFFVLLLFFTIKRRKKINKR
jgi:hypothetical protein